MSNKDEANLILKHASFCEGRYVMVKKMANDDWFTFIKDTDNLKTGIIYVGRQLKVRKSQVSHLLYDQIQKQVIAVNNLDLLILASDQLKKLDGIVFVHPFKENIIWYV